MATLQINILLAVADDGSWVAAGGNNPRDVDGGHYTLEEMRPILMHGLTASRVCDGPLTAEMYWVKLGVDTPAPSPPRIRLGDEVICERIEPGVAVEASPTQPTHEACPIEQPNVGIEPGASAESVQYG